MNKKINPVRLLHVKPLPMLVGLEDSSMFVSIEHQPKKTFLSKKHKRGLVLLRLMHS